MDVAAPVSVDPDQRLERYVRNRRVYARLRPGASIKEAQTEMDSIAQQLAEQYPHDYNVQQQYARALAETRDYDAAYAWIAKVAVPGARWLPYEEESLRNVVCDFMRQQARYPELADYLASPKSRAQGFVFGVRRRRPGRYRGEGHTQRVRGGWELLIARTGKDGDNRQAVADNADGVAWQAPALIPQNLGEQVLVHRSPPIAGTARLSFWASPWLLW